LVFFSSRRRHTRFSRDWSSDVCSSDLGGVDLDLGCLYELADGSKGVIQALGNSFGALNTPPYIHLDGDDRTGSSTGGENMHINRSEERRVGNECNKRTSLEHHDSQTYN